MGYLGSYMTGRDITVYRDASKLATGVAKPKFNFRLARSCNRVSSINFAISKFRNIDDLSQRRKNAAKVKAV